MAENSNIEWTKHTFNPWIGCQKVGPGCDHCYAETWDARGLQGTATRWGPSAERTRTSVANWRKPLAWDRAAGLAGERHRVFCASLADVFDNHASIDPQWIADLWRLIASTPNLDWMLLTKRPGNIEKMLPDGWGRGWHNVWLGCTVVNQEEADRDIPKLLKVDASVRFLSMEPLLGPVKLLGGIDLVIVGGESGPNARPMHPDWARSLRDQCVAAGVPFFFKQWGEWSPNYPWPRSATETTQRAFWHDSCGLIFDTPAQEDGLSFFSDGHVLRVGKRAAGRLLDGREWNEVPG